MISLSIDSKRVALYVSLVCKEENGKAHTESGGISLSHSECQHYVEVRGQHHASATLPRKKL